MASVGRIDRPGAVKRRGWIADDEGPLSVGGSGIRAAHQRCPRDLRLSRVGSGEEVINGLRRAEEIEREGGVTSRAQSTKSRDTGLIVRFFKGNAGRWSRLDRK